MKPIRFEVDAYDPSHRLALFTGPWGERARRLTESGLETTESAILIHAMFTEQDVHRIGFSSYRDLAERAESRAAQTRDYFRVRNGSIHAVPSRMHAIPTGVTERIGVACAILAINEVLGITEADWERIRIATGVKTMDFRRLATDGSHVVQVEAKGTVAEEPELKRSGSTSKMRKSIEEKKAETPRSLPNDVPPSDFLFGAITAIGTTEQSTPRIYLLDPPTGSSSADPNKRRLLARLRYYLRHLRLTSDFRMLAALRNRIEALQALSDVTELDGTALLDAAGEQLQLRTTGFAGRPLVDLGDLVGRVLPVVGQEDAAAGPAQVWFVGFAKALFDLLVQQQQDELVGWRWRGSVVQDRRLEFVLREPAPRQFQGRLKLGINRAGIALGWATYE